MFEMYKERMDEIGQRASELQAVANKWGFTHAESRFQKIQERRKQHDLTIAFVGKVKKGKSSLINALVGEPLLPSDILPASVCNVLVRYGDKEDAVIMDKQGHLSHVSRQKLRESISCGKLANARKAEVTLPSQFLKTGLRLVDTPGFADVDEIRSEVVNTVIPQVDALVVVLDTESGGIDASEKEFLATQVFSTHTGKIFFAMNKSDKVGEQKGVEQLLGYINAVVKAFTDHPRVFAVSSRNELQKIMQGAETDFPSGIPELRQALTDYVEKEAGSAVVNSMMRDFGNLARAVGSGLETQLKSLSESKEELQTRIETLQKDRTRIQEKMVEIDKKARRKVEDILLKFQGSLADFISRYSSKLRTAIMMLSMDDLKDPGLASELQSGVNLQMKCFMEREARKISPLLDEVFEEWNEDTEAQFSSLLRHGTANLTAILPQIYRNDSFVIPGLLIGGWVFLGMMNFLLLLLATHYAGDTIKSAVLSLIANPSKVKSDFADQVCQKLEEIRQSLYQRFSEDLMNRFQSRLTENMADYDANLDMVEQSVRNLMLSFNEPKTGTKAEEIRRDLAKIRELTDMSSFYAP
ncbi:MAG: dynamin family protein [Desulfococcaceae bacterium]|jgi:GTP-binding protein EngB required for normal cell division|nr:dynamin family protein [Desulfococcaceae bacterium]